jgi:hypothetical protein
MITMPVHREKCFGGDKGLNLTNKWRHKEPRGVDELVRLNIGCVTGYIVAVKKKTFLQHEYSVGKRRGTMILLEVNALET